MSEGYFDFVAGTGLAAQNLEDYCELQSIMRFASAAARDSALSVIKTEGMFAYLKDVNTLTVYTGSAWSTIGPVHGALPTWVPTLTQSGAVTKTVTYASYGRVGRFIHGNVILTCTGPGTTNTAITVGLPVASAMSVNGIMGAATWYTGGTYCPALVLNATTTTAVLLDSTTAATVFLGQTGSVNNAALAAGNIISYSFHYEAAGDN